MPDTTPSKDQLRGELRRRRHALNTAQQAAASRNLVRRISQLPGWPDALRIALYLAADGEIDPMLLAEQARVNGRELFLPVIQQDKTLRFAKWQHDTPLEENHYGIPEPSPLAEQCPAEALDMIFLPLVGWDRQGGRLGMGGGFYDRTLAGSRGPLLVGLAHTLQETTHIPRDHWDVPLDFIVTDTALYDCQGAH